MGWRRGYPLRSRNAHARSIRFFGVSGRCALDARGLGIALPLPKRKREALRSPVTLFPAPFPTSVELSGWPGRSCAPAPHTQGQFVLLSKRAVRGGRPHCESPRPALKNWPPEKGSGVLSEGLPTPSNGRAGKLARLLRHSLMAQPAERGEALTVTDYQAVCHRSCFYIFLEEPVLSSDGPVSLQLRASNEGLPRPRVARARRETGLPARPLFGFGTLNG